MPVISVIVPVYNTESYLHRCVDSILGQSFTDFELILVDDGSPDNCPAICDEYAHKDTRVVVIHQENGGVSSARNAGLNYAKGRYIMFCDSDDYVSKLWCKTMYEAVHGYPGAFICHDIKHVENYQVVKENEIQHQSGDIIKTSFHEIYKLGLSAYTVNKIYDAEIIRKNHLLFDETCCFGEDAVFNAAYCALCTECIYVAQTLYYYVQFPDSMMHRYHPDRLALHLPIFRCRLPLISDQELSEYCDIWLYHFLQLFQNVFDPRNTMSFIQKMKFNQRMLHSEEMRFCLTHASGNKENPLIMKILRTHNYYFFWLFDQVVKTKNKLRRKQV